MEHAPLRPVPTRPAGSGDPADAVRHVTGLLPGIDERASTALSLVALAGRTRGETAETLGLDREEVGAALARARQALRRASGARPQGPAPRLVPAARQRLVRAGGAARLRPSRRRARGPRTRPPRGP